MMKKFLCLGFAATAFLASCSNDDTVEVNPQNAIGFSTFVDKSTRATDVTTENLASFSVWAYQGTDAILTKETVSETITNDELTSDWKYVNTQYWIAGQNYAFHAIAPVTPETGDSYTYNGNSAAPSISFTNGAGLTDLIYADASVEGATADQGAVELTFSHLLSRVRFNFSEDFVNDDITIKVTDLMISGVASAGTYTNAWALTQEQTADYSFTFDSQEAWSTSIASEHLYFIPATQDLNISFTVQAFQAGVALAEASDKTATVEGFAMTAGNSYELTATFSADNVTDEDDKLNPIEFTVTAVTAWGDDWTNQAVTVTAPAADAGTGN